jgi:glutamine synthetase
MAALCITVLFEECCRFEQEYTLFGQDKRTPFGWPPFGQPDGQIFYLNYCGIGGDTVGREVMESHIRACLYAGLHIGGCNLEVLVGSCEFQLDPLMVRRIVTLSESVNCHRHRDIMQGLAAADELWMSRYILARICEAYRLSISFDPRPLEGADGCGE